MFINFGLYFWNIDLIWLGAFLRWRRLTNYKIPRFGPEICIGSIPVFCSSSLVHVVSPVLVEDVWYQRLVPSQSPAKCGKRSWGFKAGIYVSLLSFSSSWCDSASRDIRHRMHIWPVSKVESLKVLAFTPLTRGLLRWFSLIFSCAGGRRLISTFGSLTISRKAWEAQLRV